MIKVTLIGAGNVAQHLISTFLSASNIEIIKVFAQKQHNHNRWNCTHKITSSYSALQDADVYIIAVSDDAISTVSRTICHFENQLSSAYLRAPHWIP